eukprot:5608901-Karenia_brevis.AAC.1
MADLTVKRIETLATCIGKARQFLAVAPPKKAEETRSMLRALEEEMLLLRGGNFEGGSFEGPRVRP